MMVLESCPIMSLELGTLMDPIGLTTIGSAIDKRHGAEWSRQCCVWRPFEPSVTYIPRLDQPLHGGLVWL